jgi:hypothetical protein
MCISINGSEIALPGDPRVSLLDFLREQLHSAGLRRGATKAHVAPGATLPKSSARVEDAGRVHHTGGGSVVLRLVGAPRPDRPCGLRRADTKAAVLEPHWVGPAERPAEHGLQRVLGSCEPGEAAMTSEREHSHLAVPAVADLVAARSGYDQSAVEGTLCVEKENPLCLQCSNQQGRPASVMGRRRSRSPKGSRSPARRFW